MHAEFTKLFQRQMTRKEFLLYGITLLIAISGISALLKNFLPQLTGKNSGFGAGPYGGREK